MCCIVVRVGRTHAADDRYKLWFCCETQAHGSPLRRRYIGISRILIKPDATSLVIAATWPPLRSLSLRVEYLVLAQGCRPPQARQGTDALWQCAGRNAQLVESCRRAGLLLVGHAHRTGMFELVSRRSASRNCQQGRWKVPQLHYTAIHQCGRRCGRISWWEQIECRANFASDQPNCSDHLLARACG